MKKNESFSIALIVGIPPPVLARVVYPARDVQSGISTTFGQNLYSNSAGSLISLVHFALEEDDNDK